MKIYTKSGDTGETSLFGGRRLPKDDDRLQAYGTLDEVNSVLGLAKTATANEQVLQLITYIQNVLFIAGGDLASPDTDGEGSKSIPRITAHHTARLEAYIDEYDGKLPELREFILPGGTAAAAYLHVARTVCRRAEREIITLSRKENINPEMIIFINRLSDVFFMAARFENFSAGVKDITWQKDL